MTPLEATLYALTHRGNPGDRGFYAKACSRGHRILELGAGFGRLIPDLVGEAGAGHNREYWGLDREPRLLAAARRSLRDLTPDQRKRVRLIHGDMRSFALGQRFDRIILAYNGLYCLLSRRDILRCLRCVKQHLSPGGDFVFDVWAADHFCRDAHNAGYRDEPGPILSIAQGARTWDVYETSRLRSHLQRLDVTYTYVSGPRNRPVTIPIEQRYAPSSELLDLVVQAGLRVTATYGTFSGRRFHANSAHLIVRASS